VNQKNKMTHVIAKVSCSRGAVLNEARNVGNKVERDLRIFTTVGMVVI